jgi:hypothetical protein
MLYFKYFDLPVLPELDYYRAKGGG